MWSSSYIKQIWCKNKLSDRYYCISIPNLIEIRQVGSKMEYEDGGEDRWTEAICQLCVQFIQEHTPSIKKLSFRNKMLVTTCRRNILVKLVVVKFHMEIMEPVSTKTLHWTLSLTSISILSFRECLVSLQFTSGAKTLYAFIVCHTTFSAHLSLPRLIFGKNVDIMKVLIMSFHPSFCYCLSSG